jgi:hypothetical protein
MEPITIIAIIAGLILAGIISFIDDAFEKMLNPIFRLIGLQSSSGPILLHLNHRDGIMELSLTNQGKGKAKMAAIQVVDENRKKIFPTPYFSTDEIGHETNEEKEKKCRKLFLTQKIKQGETKKIFLNPSELETCDLNSLGAIDIDGNFWPSTIS